LVDAHRPGQCEELGFDSGIAAAHIAVKNIVGDVTLIGTPMT
jgi:hypothetical protein